EPLPWLDSTFTTRTLPPMAMATPTTTAMISRTTRAPSESVSWTVAASAATAGARAGSGDGERHLSAPPLIFPEVGRHDPGHVAAGPQPGEGGAIMVCGGHRAVARLALDQPVATPGPDHAEPGRDVGAGRAP